jgi:hypothetical protein
MTLSKHLLELLNRLPRRQLAWASPRNPEVSAVLTYEGMTLEPNLYLSLLADRVEQLVKQEDDPKAATLQLHQDLEQAGLSPGSDQPLRGLITNNLELRVRLREIGAMPERGEVVRGETRGARELLEEIDLETWAWTNT